MSSQPPVLSSQLCFEVYATNLAFGRAYKPLLDPLGLTYLQYLVLMVLWEQDGISLGQIGRMLDLESNTLTPLLKRMEAQGMLRRSRDPADERRVQAVLTPAGSDLRHRAADVVACAREAAGISPDEVDQLRTTMRRLRRNLQQTAAARGGGGAAPGGDG